MKNEMINPEAMGEVTAEICVTENYTSELFSLLEKLEKRLVSVLASENATAGNNKEVDGNRTELGHRINTLNQRFSQGLNRLAGVIDRLDV